MTSFDTSRVPPPSYPEDRLPSRGGGGGVPLYGYGKYGGRHGFSVPDMRFEQTFLRSIQRFVHHTTATTRSGGTIHADERAEKGAASIQENEGLSADVQVVPRPYGVPLIIDWSGILYITARDQVLSPLLQGVLWGVVSYFLRPFLRNLGAWVRISLRRSFGALFPPSQEPRNRGGGPNWMREPYPAVAIAGPRITLAKQ